MSITNAYDANGLAYAEAAAEGQGSPSKTVNLCSIIFALHIWTFSNMQAAGFRKSPADYPADSSETILLQPQLFTLDKPPASLLQKQINLFAGYPARVAYTLSPCLKTGCLPFVQYLINRVFSSILPYKFRRKDISFLSKICGCVDINFPHAISPSLFSQTT